MAKNLDSGVSLSAPFAHFDRDSCSWKTCQLSLFEALAESPLTWPLAGIASHGRALALTTLEAATGESGSSSSLFPTPTAQDYGTNCGIDQEPRPQRSQAKQGGDSLRTVASMLPTPSASLPDLIPTPTASDSSGSRRSTARKEHWTSNPGTTLTDAAQAPAEYREAIAKWVQILGRPAPPMGLPRSSSTRRSSSG